MPSAPLRVPSRTTSTYLFTVTLVAVNLDVKTSSHRFPMEIIAPDRRWGKMCDVLALVDTKGIRLSPALWVACTRLTSGRITCDP